MKIRTAVASSAPQGAGRRVNENQAEPRRSEMRPAGPKRDPAGVT